MQPVNQMIDLSEYKPHGRNYNRHPDAQIQRIMASLRKFGQPRSVVVWNGQFLAGHGVAEAARRLGWTQLRADVLPADYPEHLALAYVVADNELSRQSDPDQVALAAILQEVGRVDAELVEAAGFSEKELAALLASITPQRVSADTEPQIDKADELRQKWGVELGQLWALGEHRLVCGDCTDRATVERVMGGEQAQLCFTSPPYGQQRDYTPESVEKTSDWDALMLGCFSVVPMANDGQILVNLGLIHRDGEWIPYWEKWIEWMRSEGWRRFGWYVWDQGPGLPGDWSGRLAPSYEFVFHFNRSSLKPVKTQQSKHAGMIYEGKGGLRGKDGVVNEWSHRNRPVQDTKIADSVCRVSREKSSYLYGHPAMFSVGFGTYFIECWPGTVYEPFLGSGTTLIACENLSRRCRAVEISAGYVAVALQRWADHTNQSPVLVEAS